MIMSICLDKFKLTVWFIFEPFEISLPCAQGGG